ncbi:MAG: hypothetical protein Q8Q59_09980 [Luteolibacter sp.]|nr:hypothetical protein [Luteolibacter sp.]
MTTNIQIRDQEFDIDEAKFGARHGRQLYKDADFHKNSHRKSPRTKKESNPKDSW